MKCIAVFFDAPGYDSYPFNKEDYRRAYHELGQKVAERGGQFCIVRGQDTFMGKNQFSGGWIFEGGTFKRHDETIHTDVIYDKGYFQTDGASTVLNDRALDAVCTDKWLTYQRFPDFSPHTAKVHNREELEQALPMFQGERVVAKPLDGEEGKGVLIGSPEEILKNVTSFPYLLQAFIDTSGGIPGVVEGLHDFRIVAVSGEPVVCYVRTPPQGEMLANVARGGREIHVPLTDIPQQAMNIFKAVDANFAEFPKRVYSVDMGRDRNGEWKIIELNSKPGLTPSIMSADHARFLDLLADTLLSS